MLNGYFFFFITFLTNSFSVKRRDIKYHLFQKTFDFQYHIKNKCVTITL